MKRTLYLKLEIDWEDYEDVCDELLFQDWLDSVQVDIKGTSLTLEEDLLEEQKVKTALAMFNLFKIVIHNQVDMNWQKGLLQTIKDFEDELTTEVQ